MDIKALEKQIDNILNSTELKESNKNMIREHGHDFGDIKYFEIKTTGEKNHKQIMLDIYDKPNNPMFFLSKGRKWEDAQKTLLSQIESYYGRS